jgi:uncharacterized membrane protein
MNNKRTSLIIATAMSSVLAIGLNTYSPIANAAETETEKCAGIVKAGQNDCGANGHKCAGMSKKDKDPNEWVALPKGTCNKIVGAKTIGTDKKMDVSKTEKCAGIVKAGQNGCAANGHSCAGKATKNGDPNEWVSLPQGTCNKIVGGMIKK